MSEMLCYVDQKASISPSGGYKGSPTINEQSAVGQEFQTGYGMAQSLPSNCVNYGTGFSVPGSISPISSNMQEIGQRMSYPLPTYHSNDFGQYTVHGRTGVIPPNENQQFGGWGGPFNTFSHLPGPIAMDKEWERQYSAMHSSQIPVQPPPFSLSNATPSPASVVDERSPADLNGGTAFTFGTGGCFTTSPTLPHPHDMGQPLSPNSQRRPFEWINKNAYQTVQPPPGKTRTKDKYRVVYTDHQRLELEKEFHFSRYITIRRKAELASQLCLSERQVKIWFQNRRAKERKINKKKGANDKDSNGSDSLENNDDDVSSEDLKSSNDLNLNNKSDDECLDYNEEQCRTNGNQPTTLPDLHGFTQMPPTYMDAATTQHQQIFGENKHSREGSCDSLQNSSAVYGTVPVGYAQQSQTIISTVPSVDNHYYPSESQNLMTLAPSTQDINTHSMESSIKSLAPPNIHEPGFHSEESQMFSMSNGAPGNIAISSSN